MEVESQTLAYRARKRRRPTLMSDGRTLWRYRSLTRYLVSTSLRTERTGSVFGFVWWILDPVLLMLVYWFVFGVVFQRSEPDFPIFILVSLLSWECFVTATQASMAVTLSQERTMRQVAFPRSVIPLAVTLAELAHLVVGLIFAIIAALAVYGVVPSSRIVGLLPLVLLQGIFTLGAAFFFAAANVFFRDVSHLAAYGFRIWYFLSPGLYALTRIPERYRTIYQLNPFATFFGGYHAFILHQPMPSAAAFAYTAGVSVLTLLVAYQFFVRLAPRFAKVV